MTECRLVNFHCLLPCTESHRTSRYTKSTTYFLLPGNTDFAGYVKLKRYTDIAILATYFKDDWVRQVGAMICFSDLFEREKSLKAPSTLLPQGYDSVTTSRSSRLGGSPGLSVLTSLLVSVDVKNYRTVLRHWSQLVPNMSTDI